MNRYLHQTESTIFDCEKNKCFLFPEHAEEFTDFLNEQEEEIQNLELQIMYLQAIIKNQPAEIVKKIRDLASYCYQQIDNPYSIIDMYLAVIDFNKILDTILKEYGGKDE